MTGMGRLCERSEAILGDCHVATLLAMTGMGRLCERSEAILGDCHVAALLAMTGDWHKKTLKLIGFVLLLYFLLLTAT